MSADVSAVVVSFNAREELLLCLRSLQAQPERLLEVLVVDNASSDGSAAAAREAFPRFRVLENPSNLGFAKANNRALREARGRYALVLNSDARLSAGALASLAGYLDAHPQVAVVGPRTRDAAGGVQVSFGPPLLPLDEWRQRRLVRGVKAGLDWARHEAERWPPWSASPPGSRARASWPGWTRCRRWLSSTRATSSTKRTPTCACGFGRRVGASRTRRRPR
jgi:glycosyltransferase involved in cell wall biosynthesis